MSYPLSLINVTKQKETQFYSREILTVEQLAAFFPRRYYDFRTITPVSKVQEGQCCLIKGKITRIQERNGATIFGVRDQAGNNINITFFSQKHICQKIMYGQVWLFGGVVSFYGFYPSMTNPIVTSQNEAEVCRLLPVYPKIKNMSAEYLENKIHDAIAFLQAKRTYSYEDCLAGQLGLVGYTDALMGIHNPTDGDSYKRAKLRIDYNRMFEFYSDLYQETKYSQVVQIAPAAKTDALKRFMKTLPFPLTAGQKDAIVSITQQAVAGKRVNALITGDVGCGKTLVAIAEAVHMFENGYQTMVMAPTLVLAKQHYEEFCSRLSSFGIKVGLLTGETKKKERTALLSGLASGEIHILVGTHSILSADLRFAKLGMTIIDEEHKFGVSQKQALEEYDKLGAHHISLTATPIPRSYALTVYGDLLQVMQILDKPAGRKTTITKQCHVMTEVYESIHDEIKNWHQAYIVTPFVEDSQFECLKDVASVESVLKMTQEYFDKNDPNVRIASINGKMKQADILSVIGEFSRGEIDILISTTIVEVGVNVPNATVIAIMDAERFGIAALHQLRGRVGRKGDQGYCLLVSNKNSEKLDVLCRYASGFDIADQDLKLRGPGDLTGEAQSGDGSAEAINTILKRPKMAKIIREHLLAS